MLARAGLTRASATRAQFVLQCSNRDYTFKAANENLSTVLVHNLRQLRERARET